MTPSALYGTARANGVALSFETGGRTRKLVLRKSHFYIGLGLLGLMTFWSVVATLYFFYRDDLFASVLAREVSAQYDYEDRIASLRTALERESSRHLMLQSEVDTQVKTLVSRQAAVESHAGVLRALAEKVGFDGPPPASGRTMSQALATAPKVAAPQSAFQLRLSQDAESVAPPVPDQRSDAGPTAFTPTLEQIDAQLTRDETRQVAALDALRQPARIRVGQFRTALAMAGINVAQIATGGMKATGSRDDVGGPFVPLPSDAAQSPFWSAVARTGDDIAELARLRRVAATVPLRQPLPGQLEVSSEFGPRLDPFLGRPALHTGIDFHGESGKQVFATAAGTVTIADRDGGYGNLVEVDHGNGLVTRYAHLSAVLVTPHQHVEAGEAVGLVGATGRATGPHLHYETRVNGEPVDPTRFLKAGAPLFSGAQMSEVAQIEK
jgi:murein DD-endopeptidase MepM/ murein hydrolase activator NlpD